MNRYGQTLTWGPLSAPAFFTGEPISYSLRDGQTKQLIDGAAGDWLALALHSRKAEIQFEAKVTSASTNFLDLSAGAAIALSSISSTGSILVSRAVQRWRLSQAATASVEATWYPDMTPADGAALAGVTNSAFVPDQSASTIVTPASALVYTTYGLTHAKGLVHELTLTQSLQITEDDPSPDGLILGAATHGYEMTINLLLLAQIPSTTSPMTDYPAVDSTLAIGSQVGAPATFLITDSGPSMEMGKGMMYSIDASWISPFGS
ncbi:MAG TPA: hypothetical protein VHY22_13510 [Chthoniobacteraceae bacterium]|jgi:hypothetical protein|nr:hypothetical protein [Chthoniobacteraceae bacterium]